MSSAPGPYANICPCGQIATWANSCSNCAKFSKPRMKVWSCLSCRTKFPEWHLRDCQRSQPEKRLYWAGFVLQEIFYMFREAFFEKNITTIKTTPEYPHCLNIRLQGPRDPGAIFDLPRETPIEDQKMIFADRADDVHMVFLYYVARKLFKGHPFKVIECIVRPQNVRRAVFRTGPSTMEYPFLAGGQHAILVVGIEEDPTKLGDNVAHGMQNTTAKFVIDLTGAQFGWDRAIYPLKQYKRDHINQTLRVRKFGDGVDEFLKMHDALPRHPSSVLYIRGKMLIQAANALMKGVEKWENDTGKLFKDILMLSVEDFEAEKRRLIDIIAGCLSKQQDIWQNLVLQNKREIESGVQL